MPALMLDSDQPAVLLESRFANLRIATYADLVTPEIIAAAGPRLKVIDRGSGDPHGLATIADVERGVLSVAEGVAKVRQWLEEKRPQPTIYHNRSTWEEINKAADGLDYTHWVATLDGTMVPSGYYMAVVQAWGAAALGFHADMSIVWDDGWHRLPGGPPAAQLDTLRAVAETVARGGAQLLADIRAL